MLLLRLDDTALIFIFVVLLLLFLSQQRKGELGWLPKKGPAETPTAMRIRRSAESVTVQWKSSAPRRLEVEARKKGVPTFAEIVGDESTVYAPPGTVVDFRARVGGPKESAWSELLTHTTLSDSSEGKYRQGSGQEYTWTQTKEEMVVTIPTVLIETSRDVRVVFKADTLSIFAHCNQKPLVFFRLHKHIVPSESTWQLDDGDNNTHRCIVVTLEKKRRDDWWPRLTLQEEKCYG